MTQEIEPPQAAVGTINMRKLPGSLGSGLLLMGALAQVVACFAVPVADPALAPAIVRSVFEREYPPDARRFQGIPGVACARGGRIWVTFYTGGIGESAENY